MGRRNGSDGFVWRPAVVIGGAQRRQAISRVAAGTPKPRKPEK
jgi:hypothetical protein